MAVDTEKIEKAGELLFDSVYVPAFVKQCEARGVTFSSQEELGTALQNALLIKSAETQNEQETSSDLHKAANNVLRGAFGEDVASSQQKIADETQLSSIVNDLNLSDGVKEAASLLSSLEA